jgi:hypothetical protein
MEAAVKNPYVIDLHGMEKSPTLGKTSTVHTAVATDDGDAVYPVWRDRVNEKAGKPVTIEV